MGKYIKLFETHSDYNTYINSQDKVLPNVSYCENENKCHYNPWVETKLVCKYNITDTSSTTTLRTEYEQNMFKSMEIDGVLLDSLVTEYQFSTTGEHTVKYELYDETKVGNNAPLFYNITTLTSVSIPDSVTTIGGNVFNGCSGLTNITFPNSVTTINNGAFYNCSSLTSLTIPNSVTTIGYDAFRGCSGLTNIVIPNSITSIDSSAFQNCPNLTSVTLNSNAIVSKNYSYSESIAGIFGNQVTEFIIGNDVNSIGEYVFYQCSNLTSVTIGNSVTTIGYEAFDGCSGLTSITIPNNVTSIGEYAFNGSALTSVTIGSSVTYIGHGAFNNCRSLMDITSLAVIAPTIQSNTFNEVKTGGTLTVPSGSTGYDVWMGTGDYYLGKYNWTKVEQ